MEILYDEKNRGYNRAIRYLVVTYDLKNQEKLKCTPSISIDNEWGIGTELREISGDWRWKKKLAMRREDLYGFSWRALEKAQST